MTDLEFAEHLADLARAVTMAAFGPRLVVDQKSEMCPFSALDGADEHEVPVKAPAILTWVGSE